MTKKAINRNDLVSKSEWYY